MTRVLVLGSTGMVGSTVYAYLKHHTTFDCLSTTAKDSPIKDTIRFYIDDNFLENFTNIITDYKPDFVINCIGIIRPDETLVSFKQALLVNSIFPNVASAVCLRNNSRFIHISTDCVFDGKSGKYTDQDIPNDMSIYGMTKHLGEATTCPNLTIRTSVIGREIHTSKNLLEWFLHTRETVYGYDKVLWNGVTSLTLAKIIARIIENNLLFQNNIINIGSEIISKYELLCVFKRAFKLSTIIKHNSKIISDKTLVPSDCQSIHFADLVTPLITQIEELTNPI